MITSPFGLEDAHCATGPTSTTVSSTFRIAFMDLLLNFLHFHCRQKEKQNWRMGWNLNNLNYCVFGHVQGFMDPFRLNA